MSHPAPHGHDLGVSALYWVLRALARFWLWFFFRAVEVRHRERVLPPGPVLLCANHPNNLIDSLLLGAVLPRQVRYLATATLFRRPVLGHVLRQAGVIPVYRRQDDPDQVSRNAEMFAACQSALDRGAVLAIYPEGTTHAEARVQRLRTGAARIALEYEARREASGATPGRGPEAPPLRLIPAGLTFEARRSFGSRVLIAFGPPIPVVPHLETYRRDPVAAIETVTLAIHRALEAQVLRSAEAETTEIVRAVEGLYGDELTREVRGALAFGPRQVDTLRLDRAVTEAVAYFRRRDPGRVEALWHRIRGYLALLEDHRILDQTVRAAGHTAPRAEHPVVRILWILGVPVSVYGAAVNGIPYLVPRWLARRVARRETDYATVRFLASIVAFPVVWGAEMWIVARFVGPLGVLALFFTLPLSGLVARGHGERIRRRRSQRRFLSLASARGHVAARLVAERSGILAELDRARSEYLAATRRAEP